MIPAVLCSVQENDYKSTVTTCNLFKTIVKSSGVAIAWRELSGHIPPPLEQWKLIQDM